MADEPVGGIDPHKLKTEFYRWKIATLEVDALKHKESIRQLQRALARTKARNVRQKAELLKAYNQINALIKKMRT